MTILYTYMRICCSCASYNAFQVQLVGILRSGRGEVGIVVLNLGHQANTTKPDYGWPSVADFDINSAEYSVSYKSKLL
jgi:hypothetical protein